MGNEKSVAIYVANTDGASRANQQTARRISQVQGLLPTPSEAPFALTNGQQRTHACLCASFYF